MYYLNRKTSRKAWNRPEEEKIDLDLNISICSEKQNNWGSDNQQEMINEQQHSSNSSSSSSMIALVCSNCHLLVILSRTSPSCPNCKYVHSLATSPQARPDSSFSSSYRNLSLWTRYISIYMYPVRCCQINCTVCIPFLNFLSMIFMGHLFIFGCYITDSPRGRKLHDVDSSKFNFHFY